MFFFFRSLPPLLEGLPILSVFKTGSMEPEVLHIVVFGQRHTRDNRCDTSNRGCCEAASGALGFLKL